MFEPSAATFGHAEGQSDIDSTGVGLTAGYVFTAKTEATLEHGPQIQFLAAPDAKLKLRVTDAEPDNFVCRMKATSFTPTCGA